MLIISPPLAAEIAACLPESRIESLSDPEVLSQISDFAKAHPTFRWLGELARAVLDEQGVVQIRGLSISEAAKCFPLIGSAVGSIYVDPSIGTAIIPAHVKPDEHLMGNQLRPLPFHTDYSMHEAPPRVTMSLCVEPDPHPCWGNVLVSDIESLIYGLDGHPDIQPYFEVVLPFAAQNLGENIDFVERPILAWQDPSNHLIVRYHRSRIVQGFKHLGRSPSQEQAEVMLSFERLAASNCREIMPESGDITIIDNHRTVHARTQCSVTLNIDRSTCGRKMKFLFLN